MTPDEREICKVHSTWIDAVKAGDLSRLLLLMADDVVLLSPGQGPVGQDGFCAVSWLDTNRVGSIAAASLTKSWSLVKSPIRGAGMICRCTRVTVEMRRSSPVIESRFYRKQPDGRWRLARDAHTLSPVAEVTMPMVRGNAGISRLRSEPKSLISSSSSET